MSDLYILVAGEILQGGIGALNTLVANAPEPASGDKTPKTSSQDEVPVDIEKAAAPATQYATPPSILREGDVFGEIAFFTGTAQLRGATTLTVVRVLAISRSAYDQVASTFKSSARHVLNHLSRSAEEATMDMFPGAGGLDVYKKAMAAAEAGEIGEGWNDPTWHLSAKDAKSLRLSLQQEAAIGNYVRVKQVVAQRVAQYDEDFTAEFLYAASRGEVVKMTEVSAEQLKEDCHTWIDIL